MTKHHLPLSSSDHMEVFSPLFMSPVLLLSFITLFSLGRWIHTRASPWLDFNEQARSRSWTALTKLLVTLCIVVLLTLFVDCGVITARALVDSVWTSTLLTFYESLSFLAWLICLWTLMDELHKFGHVYWIQYCFWIISVLAETCVGWLWALTVKRPESGTSWTIYEKVLLGAFITRYILQWLLVILSVVHIFSRSTSVESTPLLNANHSTRNGDYGATPMVTTSATGEPKSAFSDLFTKMGELLPFIWPHNNRRLQSLVVLSFALMVLGLVINACTPYQIGYVVDHIGKGKFAWAAVLVYMGFKFLQGGSGLIQCVQNFLWVPVNQYTTREVSIKLFEHLHLLSLGFHLNRKTGEVLRVMDRGTNSVVQLLSQILFQIFPAIANILIAVFLFAITFSPAYGGIVFVTMALYLYVTITMTEWRTKFRRDMIDLDNSARAKAVDSLLNFETVKYYGNSDYEVNRYRDAIAEYQKADWKSSASLNVLNLAQNSVISLGLFVGCLLFAYEVSLDRFTAGDFVIFNVYMIQLYSPLHWFGTYYRMIQTNFIDMEKMLDLFKEELTVKDIPGAPDLLVKEGAIVFDNVTFTYDNRQTALNGVSFTVPAGKKVALVGPSGSGKSTIIRLLFRFYDPTTGSISIDGQNIRNVKQTSLRHNIGVVPQDCVLFNDTIMYNLQYGNIHASKEEVYQAAKAAQIHDKIISFPDGYETKVGERGLRLSTGEKQRVAIGRTILKNPPIILLDEATSSLDTLTERHIQQALSNVTTDRTTVIIAHRLSTIVNADLILVIKDGRVAESGTHEELLKQGAYSNSTDQGIYWEMWQKQLREDNDTESTSTLGEMKIKNMDLDGGKDVATDLDAPNDINNKLTTETHNQQQMQNVDNSCTNQVKQIDHPTTIPRLDIPPHDPELPSTHEQVLVSSPVEAPNSQGNNDEEAVVSSPIEAPNSQGNNDEEAVVSSPIEASNSQGNNDEEAVVSSPIEASNSQGNNDEEAVVSSPIEASNSQGNNDEEAPGTPSSPIPIGSTSNDQQHERQQPSDKDNKSKSKAKSKNKKNRKRKSTRNSTTFR
ncbi:hypothetical protein BC941DRAFT_375486 [Chlamydoabsidia padenii]|nr:hypothetical protein BC941DRAFT_375486 [Chlamydoabsidia padenii]